MDDIDSNHWVDNSLSISLLNFGVKITVKCSNNKIYTQLEIVDDNMDKYIFKFDTIEEAVDFTGNVINKYKSIKKISIIYEEKYNKHNEDKKVDKMILTPDEVKKAIIDCFRFNNNYKDIVFEELELKNDIVNVKYYLNFTIIHKNKRIRLKDGEIKKVLNNYIKIYDCNLVNYEYIGDILKLDDGKDSIHYKGIELTIKKKEKLLVLD